MSDLMKERYQQEFKQCRPSAEFLDAVTQELERASAETKHKKITVQWTAAMAACLLALIVCSAVLFGRFSAFEKQSENGESAEGQPNEIRNPLDYLDAGIYNAKPIDSSSIFDENMTAEECAAVFLEKADGGELAYIKISDSNVFTSAWEDGEQTESLFALLADGKNTDRIPDGEKLYYMAVFTDGKVVKLVVTDGKYLEFQGTGKYLCSD